MDELKSYGRSLGLNETQIGVALRLDRSATETIWVSTADSVRVAEQVFEKGRLLEYECLDNDGKNQGNATLELLEWASEGDGFFRGQHMGASDEYYEWYASQALVPPENCLYHLCSSDPAACKKKPRRGDRREVVHIGRWRLLTPLVMVEEPYLEREGVRFGKQAMDDMARDVRAHKAGPFRVSPVGTGLDAVMAEPPKPPDDRGGGKEPKRKKSRSRSPRKGPKGLAGYLRERAEAHQQKQADESRRGRRREKEKKSRAEKEARRKAKDLGDSSSSDDESSAGSSVFRTAPSRGGNELRRIAQKKPGKLLEESLQEMARFLAEREEEEGGEGAWKGRRVMAYVAQVMLVTHPPAKIGIRNHREVISIATALDQLLQGKLAECGDLLVQRLKALETSFVDGSWNSARHQELIPEMGATMTSQKEREQTAKAELRSLKLKQALQKAK